MICTHSWVVFKTQQAQDEELTDHPRLQRSNTRREWHRGTHSSVSQPFLIYATPRQKKKIGDLFAVNCRTTFPFGSTGVIVTVQKTQEIIYL